MRWFVFATFVVCLSAPARAEFSRTTDSMTIKEYRVPDEELDDACKRVKNSEKNECLKFISAIKKSQQIQDSNKKIELDKLLDTPAKSQ